MSHSNSTKAVVFALLGNMFISIIKYIAAFFTLSASMLAEAIHSTADCLNQVFLLIGTKRSKKENDELHPFGYGREEFFWGFMVAILLFFGGAIFSIYEGVHKLMEPIAIKNIGWGLAVLGVSMIIEGKTFMIALKQLRETSKNSIIKALKDSVDTNLIVIILEDSAALLGLVIAFICTLLSLYNPIFDAIGSISIGLILSFVSYSLVNELRKLIIGENMPREERGRIKQILNSFPDVTHVNRIKSMTMGRNKYLLLISINVNDFLRGHKVEDMVENIKEDIKEEFNHVDEIYVEISDK
jgi:cation diffusion facilitator family transporter